jgi:hypothetical protein
MWKGIVIPFHPVATPDVVVIVRVIVPPKKTIVILFAIPQGKLIKLA